MVRSSGSVELEGVSENVFVSPAARILSTTFLVMARTSNPEQCEPIESDILPCLF